MKKPEVENLMSLSLQMYNFWWLPSGAEKFPLTKIVFIYLTHFTYILADQWSVPLCGDLQHPEESAQAAQHRGGERHSHCYPTRGDYTTGMLYTGTGTQHRGGERHSHCHPTRGNYTTGMRLCWKTTPI